MCVQQNLKDGELHTMVLLFTSEKEQSRALDEGMPLIYNGVLWHCERLIQSWAYIAENLTALLT